MKFDLFERLRDRAVAAMLPVALVCVAAAPQSALAMTRTYGASHHAPSHVASSSRSRGRAAASTRGGHAAKGHAVAGRSAGRVAGRNVVTIVRGRRVHKFVAARYSERFSAPSFAQNVDNITLGDVTAGEDPLVRASLIQALGNMNGT